MNTVLWILQVVLTIKLISSAFTHGLQQSQPTLQSAIQKLGKTARPVLAVSAGLMLLGSLGLILPGVLKSLPGLVPLSAALLAVLLLASIPLHLKSRETPRVFVSVILFILAALVVYGRWVLAPL